MTDALAIIGDLVKRVHRLERNQMQGATLGSPRPRKALAPMPSIDPDTAAILRYLTASAHREAEDLEVRAIRDYLMTPSKGRTIR